MDIMSPAVVTSEHDLSFVAPAISTSIAAVMGAARKGPVNRPSYITTPSEYEERFGAPLTTDYAGHCAILYLKQANMLWFNRVGSLRGSDPVATANTDERAELDQTDVTAFQVPTDIMDLATPATKYLRLRFDSETAHDLTITFSSPICASLIRATLDDTMQALCNFINTQLSGNDTFEPRYGFATYVAATPTGRRLKLYTQSKNGPGSKIEVLAPTMGDDAAASFGWTSGLTAAQGDRTVLVTVAMTKAEIDSVVAGPSGAYNLGAGATANSASAENFNLGEFAEGDFAYENAGLVPAEGHSFVLSFGSSTAADLNTIGSLPYVLYAQLKATPYDTINPYIRMYVDGYTVEFQVPLTTWPAAGALTNTQLQQLVNIINAACPAQLGPIAYWSASESKVIIQSVGKNTNYSYIQIPEGQPDSPTNNASAARLFLMAMNLGMNVDTKVSNSMVVEVDGVAKSLSFSYDSLVAQGYRPAFLTNDQLVSVINAQLGQPLASSTSGLDLTMVNATPGLYGSLKMYGQGYSRALIGTAHEYGPSGFATWYAPKTGTKIKAENYQINTYSGTDVDSVLYVKFSFGSDWAWVSFKNVAYNVARQTFALGNIAVLSTSFVATTGQLTTFRTALTTALSAHAVKARAGAFGGYITSDTAWTAAVPTVGTSASVMRAAVNVGTVVILDIGTGGAGVPGRYYVSYHLVSGVAPEEGDVLSAAGPSTLNVDRAYADRDVAIYISNVGPLAIGSYNCTGVADSYVVYKQSQGSGLEVTGDIAPFGGVSDQLVVAAGNVQTATASTVIDYTSCEQFPGGSILLVMALDFVIAAKTYTAIVAVVPDGESYFTEGLPICHPTNPVTHPLVDLVTICPANGLTIDFTQAGSYAFVDYTGTPPTLNVLLNGVQTSAGDAVTAVRYGFVGTGTEARFVRCPSTTPSSAAAPQAWLLGSKVYNPLTNSFHTVTPTLSLIDDYGEGWNLLGLLVDDTYSVAINFNDYSFVDRSAATAAEVANAINMRAKAVNLTLDGLATITSGGAVQLTSPTKGATSKLQCTLDNPALNLSAITTVPAIGSGYPTFSVKIDGGKQYDIDFGVYVGDLIQNQQAALASEIAAALRRALAISTTQCWDSGIGATSQVHLTSAIDGSQGTVEVVSPNLALGGGFGVTGTTTGTESTVAPCTIYGLTPGTWANPDEDNIKLRFTDEDSLFYAPNSSQLDILVNGVIEETYHGVVPDPDADDDPTASGTGIFIETAIGNATSVGKDDNPSELVYCEFDEAVTEGAGYTTGTKFKPTPIGEEYELSGGANGIEALDEFDLIGVADHPIWNGPTGLQVWRDKDNRFVNLMVTPGATQYSVISEMLQICESRGDCMAIIDPPFGLKPQQVIEWHNGRGYGNTTAINSSYGALYSTWILYSDPYNQEKVWLPPSCFMLAVYAYNDKVAESWFAPAGLTRGKVSGAQQLQYTPSFGDRELMYGTGNSVNPIVDFSKDGITVWGQKTLQRTASALDRVNVRRLLLYLRTMAELTARVMVFEPNDQNSRKKLVNMLEGIANDVMRRRGLRRAKIEDKTTDRLINLKRARIVFFLEPTQSMEIIEIPFIITGSGQAFIDVTT